METGAPAGGKSAADAPVRDAVSRRTAKRVREAGTPLYRAFLAGNASH